MLVREPVGEDFIALRGTRGQPQKDARVQVRKGIQILDVDLLDPLAVFGGTLAVADTDRHGVTHSGPKKSTARADGHHGRPPGLVQSTIEACYGFAADAAEAAESAAALAADASLAADAAESEAAAGGVASGAGAGGASVLLPQALSTNAATKALRASLVFIYRYPENFDDKTM